MKCIVYKGSAFRMSGENWSLVIEGGGILNRVDPALWDLAYKKFKSVLDSDIERGVLVMTDTQDKDTFRDDEANKDAFSDAMHKQSNEMGDGIEDESPTPAPIQKSEKRIALENKAMELGLVFDDAVSSNELKRQVQEAMKAQ